MYSTGDGIDSYSNIVGKHDGGKTWTRCRKGKASPDTDTCLQTTLRDLANTGRALGVSQACDIHDSISFSEKAPSGKSMTP